MIERVNHNDLEQALRRALRPTNPAEGFADQILARLESESRVAPARGVIGAGARHARVASLARWLPTALAACLLVGIGLAHWREQRLEQQRGLQAREQVLQALRIASADLNAARAGVLRAEQSIR